MLNASWHRFLKDTPVETLTSTDSDVGYLVMVGAGVGVGVGAGDGTAVGTELGTALGTPVGMELGSGLGIAVVGQPEGA